MAAKTVNYASPADVRSWGTENGFTVGKRGLFSDSLVKAYNKAHKSRKYVPASYEKTITVVAKRPGKTPLRRNIVESKARAWAAENGHTVGKRGTLPKAVREAYVISLSK